MRRGRQVGPERGLAPIESESYRLRCRRLARLVRAAPSRRRTPSDAPARCDGRQGGLCTRRTRRRTTARAPAGTLLPSMPLAANRREPRRTSYPPAGTSAGAAGSAAGAARLAGFGSAAGSAGAVVVGRRSRSCAGLAAHLLRGRLLLRRRLRDGLGGGNRRRGAARAPRAQREPARPRAPPRSARARPCARRPCAPPACCASRRAGPADGRCAGAGDRAAAGR